MGNYKIQKPQIYDYHSGANTAPKLPFKCQSKRRKTPKHFKFLLEPAVTTNKAWASNELKEDQSHNLQKEQTSEDKVQNVTRLAVNRRKRTSKGK